MNIRNIKTVHNNSYFILNPYYCIAVHFHTAVSNIKSKHTAKSNPSDGLQDWQQVRLHDDQTKNNKNCNTPTEKQKSAKSRLKHYLVRPTEVELVFSLIHQLPNNVGVDFATPLKASLGTPINDQYRQQETQNVLQLAELKNVHNKTNGRLARLSPLQFCRQLVLLQKSTQSFFAHNSVPLLQKTTAEATRSVDTKGFSALSFTDNFIKRLIKPLFYVDRKSLSRTERQLLTDYIDHKPLSKTERKTLFYAEHELPSNDARKALFGDSVLPKRKTTSGRKKLQMVNFIRFLLSEHQADRQRRKIRFINFWRSVNRAYKPICWPEQNPVLEQLRKDSSKTVNKVWSKARTEHFLSSASCATNKKILYNEIAVDIDSSMVAARKRTTSLSIINRQFQEKRKLSLIYGYLPHKQIDRLISKTLHSPKRWGYTSLQFFLGLVEGRADVILYRSGFAANIFAAKKMVSHGLVKINDQVITSPNIGLNPGDILKVSCSALNHMIRFLCLKRTQRNIHRRLMTSAKTTRRSKVLSYRDCRFFFRPNAYRIFKRKGLKKPYRSIKRTFKRPQDSYKFHSRQTDPFTKTSKNTFRIRSAQTNKTLSLRGSP